MKFILYMTVFFALFLRADDYEMGHGLKLNDALNLGAYFSTDYTASDEQDRFRLDDVAVLAYGAISPMLTYMAEFEAAPLHVHDFRTDTSETDLKFHYERMYIDYSYSEMFNLRIGKQITPIGYWNLEPINVLRDTSSNPLYSTQMFPKLLTGLDLYGHLDDDNRLKYHLFAQLNDDIDEDYINIKNDHFLGASLDYEFSDEIGFGGSLGEYITKDDDKHIKFAQINAKYYNYPLVLQTEMAYNDIYNDTLNKNSYQFAGYAQGIYNFNLKYAIIGRYEYFDDNQVPAINHIGIIGYSYRPLYSISIKAEYQLNSDSHLNKSIVSFSVLF